MTSGWLPCSRPSETRRVGRMEQRALPFDDVPVLGGRIGLSISAAPASKSATTASIGMPPPEIRMPVWPVARKSASTPRAAKARASASAVYFLPSAQSVPTVSRRLPVRLRPVPHRDVRAAACGRRSAAGRSAPRRPSVAASSASFACMPLTMSRPDSSASTSSGHPALADHAARIGDADHQRRARRARAPPWASGAAVRW